MPSIPTLRESQRLSQGGVSGFQDASVARSAGENIQTLGKAISSASNMLKERRKTDSFSRSQWVKLAAAEAAANKNRFLSTRRDSPLVDDGSKLEGEYNEFSTESGSKFLESVPEEFRSEAELAYRTSQISSSADVLKESELRRNRNKVYMYNQTTKENENSASLDPDNADKYLQSSLDNLKIAADSQTLDPSLYDNYARKIQKGVAMSQINGYMKQPSNSMDIPIYDKAFEALERNKALFDEDGEFDKIRSTLETAKYTGIERITKKENDAAEALKKSLEVKQEAEIDMSFQQIVENSNDVQKVQVLKQNLIDRFKAGKYKYASPKFFNAFKTAEDTQDAAMSYEIAKELGNNPTNKQINDMRDRVKYAVADDKIGTEKGQYWLLRLSELKEKNKQDPNYSKKVKSLYSFINASHGVGSIEELTDLDGDRKKSMLQSIYQVDSMLGKGVKPEAVEAYLRSKYTEQKSISNVPGSFPFSDKTTRTLDNSAAFEEEEEDIYNLRERGRINDTEYKRRMKDTMRKRQEFEAKKSLKEKNLDSFINGLENTPLVPQTQFPFRR